MLETGTQLIKSYTVTAEMTAHSMKSGELDVLATPYLIALMEDVASASVKPYLEDGKTSVGTRVDMQHLAATPIGATVRVTSTLTAVEGRLLRFALEATDNGGVIGTAVHERVIVDAERFMQKVAQKREA